MLRNSLSLEQIYSDKKIDGLFITNLNNIRYLSGFTGSSAFLILSPKGNYFLTDFRYKIQSQIEVNKNFKYIFYQKKVIFEITNILKKNKIKRLGIEGNDIDYNMAVELKNRARIKLINCSEELSSIRKFKTSDEIKLIKRSLRCAEISFHKIRRLIKPGLRERDIAIELEYQIKKNGADDIAFPIIVASGKRSALPHAQPTNKKIRDNEFIIIDFGARIKGYNSDITYTVNLNNKNKILTEAYKTVKQSIYKAIEMIKLNRRTDNVDKAIHEFIQKQRFKEGLIHGLGHGVGLDIHEQPVINRNKKDIFKEGMVFTIEPGIYLENIGGVRIELMGCLTKQGLKILNNMGSDPQFPIT